MFFSLDRVGLFSAKAKCRRNEEARTPPHCRKTLFLSFARLFSRLTRYLSTPMAMNSSTRPFLWIVGLLVASSCTQKAENPRPAEGNNPQTSSTLAASAPVATSTPTTATTAPAAPAAGGMAAQAATDTAPPPKAVAEATQALAGKLVDAVSRKDSAAAQALFVTNDQVSAVITEGYVNIIGAGAADDNRAVVNRLIEAIGGRTAKWTFRGGRLAAGRGAFKSDVDVLSGGSVEIEADGVFVIVDIPQMVKVNDEWRIFRLESSLTAKWTAAFRAARPGARAGSVTSTIQKKDVSEELRRP